MSSIFNILAMHRSQQLKIDLEIDAERHHAERMRQLCDITQEIRDNMTTQDEYDAWWEAAPERGFYDAACAKLLDMKLNGGVDLIDIDNWAELDGTQPSPIILGGEILYPNSQPSNIDDESILF